jgi:hypothetical protein
LFPSPRCWYQQFEGGLCWYTSLGHRKEVYHEADFRKHSLGGIFGPWAGKSRPQGRKAGRDSASTDRGRVRSLG